MPAKSEHELVRYSLPSCYAVHPDEVIVCLDEPPHEPTRREVVRIAARFGWERKTKIITVPENPGYRLHQAWVRRQGFRAAKHDRILTVDVDLVINKNVLKALGFVGRDDVGMVSCATLHYVGGFLGLWRAGALQLASRLHPPAYTGLYALWRPFWLDTEDEGIKLLQNPKTRAVRGGLVLVGEDTYLHNCMQLKHRCVHLRDVGGYTLRNDCNDNSHIQFEAGRYYAENGYSFAGILLRAVAFGRPHILLGYSSQKIAREPLPTCNPDTYPL